MLTHWIKNNFEISHTAHKGIQSMEGIRGFAVFLVFLVHYVAQVEPWLSESSITQTISTHVASIGNIGVDLFFVLSGFLIYGSLIRKPHNFGEYLLRRIQRVYPTFTAVFIIYLILSFAFPSESKIPNGWDGAIFVLQNFLLLPGLFDIPAIITVAWSLSYEFFFYLLTPLLITLLGLRLWNREKRVTLFACASLVLFILFALYSEGDQIRLLMFVSGILLFETTEKLKSTKIPPIGLPALAIAIAATIVLADAGANGWWKFALLFVLFYAFCLDCFSSDGIANRIFKFSPMRWLGNMSYSYYLIHGLPLKFFFMVMPVLFPPGNGSDWLFWLALPVSFAATLVPSAILFLYVETPLSLSTKKPANTPSRNTYTPNSAINLNR